MEYGESEFAYCGDVWARSRNCRRRGILLDEYSKNIERHVFACFATMWLHEMNTKPEKFVSCPHCGAKLMNRLGRATKYFFGFRSRCQACKKLMAPNRLIMGLVRLGYFISLIVLYVGCTVGRNQRTNMPLFIVGTIIISFVCIYVVSLFSLRKRWTGISGRESVIWGVQRGGHHDAEYGEFNKIECVGAQ